MWQRRVPLAPEAQTRERFERMVRERFAAVRARAFRLSGNDTDADDLAQLTMERAWRHFDRFEPGSGEQAWLFRILFHAFIDICRRRKLEPVPSGFVDPDTRAAASEVPEPPEWAHISVAQLQAAVMRLPEAFRVAYQLHAFEEKSYEEIATKLGIDQNTVGTRLFRAREKLRRILATLTGGDAK